MTSQNTRLAVAIVAVLIPTVASAQHEGHQAAGAQAPSAELTQCLRVQPVIENVITAATARAEAARLSNSPTELRAAVEQLEAALRDVRVQSAPCAAAAASSDPHAGHTMPSAQSPTSPATPQAPTGATDPHAGHKMPSTAPASKGSATKPAPAERTKPASADPHAGHGTSGTTPAAKPAPAAKPGAAKPEPSKAADPHAGHSAAPSGGKEGKEMDPVNGLMVDPVTAPKTTYQGQTYYFSSEQSRKEFLANPAKFAKKPKG